MWMISPRVALLSAFAISLVSIVGAHLFERVGGYFPCALCLDQREVHWAALALAGVGLIASRFQGTERWLAAGLGALTVAYLFSTGLAGYHAGVEWDFWEGPSACAGGRGNAPLEMPVDGFFESLNEPSSVTVSCDEAAWRMMGISMAGYNALISLAMAAIAGLGCFAAAKRWRNDLFTSKPKGAA